MNAYWNNNNLKGSKSSRHTEAKASIRGEIFIFFLGYYTQLNIKTQTTKEEFYFQILLQYHH